MAKAKIERGWMEKQECCPTYLPCLAHTSLLLLSLQPHDTAACQRLLQVLLACHQDTAQCLASLMADLMLCSTTHDSSTSEVIVLACYSRADRAAAMAANPVASTCGIACCMATLQPAEM